MRFCCFLTTAAALLLVISIQPLRASDIGGEIEPPPCTFNANGSVASGVAACAGPMTISLLEDVDRMFAVDLSSRGNPAKPWTIFHNMKDTDFTLEMAGGFGPVLPLDSDPWRQGNPTDSQRHWFLRAFGLTIRNSSDIPWMGFELELQRTRGVSSSHLDNISFGQIQRNPEKLYEDPSSDVFRTFDIEANTKDWIGFGNGFLAPGQEATLFFLISDNGPTSRFYLTGSAVAVPEPATALLTVVSLAAFAAIAERRRRAVRARS